MNQSGEHAALTRRMSIALRHLSEHPGGMVVAWKNTPHIVASGTAEALVKRGLALYDRTLDQLARGLSQHVIITEAGRAEVARQSGSVAVSSEDT